MELVYDEDHHHHHHHHHHLQRPSRPAAFRGRDASPDSVIFTLESNFSLFSSASASVERCSFASDAHDHDHDHDQDRDSLSSELSLNLAVSERESSSGPDPDPKTNPNKTTTVLKHSRGSRKVDKVKVQKDDILEDDLEEDNQEKLLDSARNSFSLALKECQERRSRSEAVGRKSDRQRPASLDFNNATISSPRLGAPKKSPMASRKSGTFPSPGTPNYRHGGVALQKGWSSERVPLQSIAGRKNVNAAFVPFNNGRTLPSKWEDAERWIFSPIGGDGGTRPPFPPPQRKPKSKSGPLGPPGVAYYSLYSPAMPMYEGGSMGNFTAGSPFSAGVIAAERLAIRSSGNGDGVYTASAEPCMGRSASVHGCSELVNQPSTAGAQDEKFDELKDAGTDISRDVSRRDMATQMSPQGSACSSPKRRPSLAVPTSSTLPIVELQNVHGSKLEVKDVQVDERVTMTRWSKKNKYGVTRKALGNIDDRKKKEDVHLSAWDIADNVKSISRVNREEAKIAAWENLQKAKAEAAIRKLEMKLEKKRSSSMDKIMKKLRLAQKRAHEMRSSVLANQAHQVARMSHKAMVFRRTRQISSLSGCFTCHAF